MSIGDLIAVIFGTGGVGTFLGTYIMFYRAKRRAANAEASTSEHTAESAALKNVLASMVEWKEIAETREIKLNAADAKIDAKDKIIDRLYVEKGEDRKDVHRLLGEVAQLSQQLQASKFIECNRRKCNDREPQTGY